jgi:Kae1-associated kinase Bud32
MEKIIKRGAEAILYLKGGALVKERIRKGYRARVLDRTLRKARTIRESRLLAEASRAGVNVPQVLSAGGFSIRMSWLGEANLKRTFNAMPAKTRRQVCRLIGESVAALHAADIVHGDLTTSNMIFKERKLFLIDFGLGLRSKRIEDKATDLFLLYGAFKAAHFQWLEDSWKTVLKAYTQKYGNAPTVLSRLEKIKSRRRYK